MIKEKGKGKGEKEARAARVGMPHPSVVRNGAEDWNRTSDTSIFSAVLYRLSYLGMQERRKTEPSS